jgi:hypothetical protein
MILLPLVFAVCMHDALTEDALVESNRTIATDLVALFKALGGGGDLLNNAQTE